MTFCLDFVQSCHIGWISQRKGRKSKNTDRVKNAKDIFVQDPPRKVKRLPLQLQDTILRKSLTFPPCYLFHPWLPSKRLSQILVPASELTVHSLRNNFFVAFPFSQTTHCLSSFLPVTIGLLNSLPFSVISSASRTLFFQVLDAFFSQDKYQFDLYYVSVVESLLDRSFCPVSPVNSFNHSQLLLFLSKQFLSCQIEPILFNGLTVCVAMATQP